MALKIIMQSEAEIKGVLLKTLQNFWGYSSFRTPQEEIILSVIRGKDTLALLPTGGGKSLCYQLPALVLEGVCLVVSPLLALIKDQVTQLKSIGVEAEYLSSELDENEQEEIYARAAEGITKLLYVSPERLSNSMFLQKITNIHISFIAVDEAHCISEWGQDFRPSYQRIGEFRKLFGDVPCLALTATATPKVIADIETKLTLKSPQIFQKSYKRDNLRIFHEEISDKYQRILDFMKNNSASGIIYVRTRKEAEELTAFLKQKGIENVDFYHAGLSLKDKNQNQKKWQQSSSHTLVSTNAFGMGIDKENVRFIIHFSPSVSLENYYQEIGRAGRDGHESYALLLWNEQEFSDIDDVFRNQIPNKTEFLSILSFLYSIFQIAEGEASEKIFKLNIQKIKDFTKTSFAKIKNVLNFLHNQELVFWNNYKDLSTLELKISAEDLELLPPKEAYFVEFLLRNISGIATHKVAFSEEILSRKLGISVQEIQDRIQYLEEKELVEYVDGSADSIKFLKPRNTREFQGKYWTEFQQIQRNKLQKWEEMKYFIRETDYCKMKMILTYFGEKNARNCHKCYICQPLNSMQNLSAQILNVLNEKPMTFDEVRAKLNLSGKEEIFETLVSLLNEHKIKMLDYKTYTTNEQ
jgi:ATP-dependent DNA helicase, recQ family